MAPVNHANVHVVHALHEATLQDLLHAKNDAIFKLISEHNNTLYECLVENLSSGSHSLCLCRERLGSSPIVYSYHNFITLPDALLPYIVVCHGAEPARILRFHVSRPQYAFYPPDRRLFDACTQTNDPDATLVEIAPSTSNSEVVNRKRKWCASA
ncbi:hypothetical protein EDB85DRAFT_1886722 [Lactarius pseudohatsudake]|nr:hypothetical protein EDB85DRAFT_1886722 [Lactarius pseudohatsudake]